MFLSLKKILLIISFIFINGCALKNENLPNTNNINSFSIETSDNADNILFKEHLKRLFKFKGNRNHKFKLITSIIFSSSATLSSNGLNAMTKTFGIVNYKLYNIKSMKLIKSGSVKSFPIIGSTSNSLYTNDISLKHIKERLNINMSNKLYMYLNLILRRLE